MSLPTNTISSKALLRKRRAYASISSMDTRAVHDESVRRNGMMISETACYENAEIADRSQAIEYVLCTQEVRFFAIPIYKISCSQSSSKPEKKYSVSPSRATVGE